MTTTLSGNLNFSGNAPSWANDGDEADFNVQESGHISLSISINNGVVTGTATASNIAYSGSTPDDKDGDNDAFSVSGLSGTGTVSGTTSNVIATIGLRNGTAGVVLRGSLNSAGTQFTGNAQVFDNLVSLMEVISTATFRSICRLVPLCLLPEQIPSISTI